MGNPSQYPCPCPPISPMVICSSFMPVTEPMNPAKPTFKNALPPSGSTIITTAVSWKPMSVMKSSTRT